MSFYTFLFATLLYSVYSQLDQITIPSNIKFAQLYQDPDTLLNFTLLYYNKTDSNGNNSLSLTLNMVNYDAQWITATNGSQGFWFGIGFDSLVMAPTNVIVCRFYYFGYKSSNKFSCMNGLNPYPSGNPTIYNNPHDDISNIRINQYQLNSNQLSNGSFSVTFEKPFYPTNMNDAIIRFGEVAIIWAYGSIQRGFQQMHEESGTGFIFIGNYGIAMEVGGWVMVGVLQYLF